MSTEGAGSCDCKATLYNLGLILATGKTAQRLEESNCHSCLPEGQEGGPRLIMISLTLNPEEVIKQLILETISRHMKEKILGSQHGFTKRKEVMLDQPYKLL